MEFLLAKELSEKNYILAGKKAIFHRYCDSGFKTKWTGFWVRDLKFIEYFAFKINDQWLSPNNCVSFHENETSASHFYELDRLKVKEFLFIPEDSNSLVCILSIENKTEKEVFSKILVEVAINIRRLEEGWHNRTYEFRSIEEKVIINSKLGSVVFSSFPKGEIEKIPTYKDHSPSGELHRCFIPGNYIVKVCIPPRGKSDIFYLFTCGENEEKCLEEHERNLSSIASLYLEKDNEMKRVTQLFFLDSNIEFLNRLFRICVVELQKLWKEDGFSSFIAGYPWYLQIWGRDLCWTIPAIADLGDFEKAKKSLEVLAKFQSEDGRIPNLIFFNGKCSFNSLDSTPLWIIALKHYIKLSGDLEFLRKIKPNLEKCLSFLKSREDKDGFLISQKGETWMDTLGREGKNIEIQSFYIEALKSSSYLFDLLGEKSKSRKFKESSLKLKRNLKKFWNKEEKFYVDNLDKKIKTCNVIFPLFFDLFTNPKDVFRKLESEEFTSKFGIRSISKKESLYEPSSYHTGSVWAWITGLMAGCEFKFNRIKKGLEYLSILNNFLGKRCIGAIPEAWNSETGDTLLLKPRGYEESSLSQAWNYASIIRVIDECLLGLEIDVNKDIFIARPSLPKGCRILRRKIIRDDIVDLIFERKGNKINFKYSSQNQKEYRFLIGKKI